MIKINLNFFKFSLNRFQKWEVLFGILLNILTIFVELFSITALIPLIVVILEGDILNIDLGYLNKFKLYFIDFLIIENLKIILIFTFGLFLFKSFFFLFITYYNARLQGNITSLVSNEIFKKYLQNTFFVSNSKTSSELINDCTVVAEDFVKNCFVATILAIKSFLTLIFILYFLLILYPEIISKLFLILISIYFIYYLIVKKILINLGKKKIKLSEKLIKILKESSSALKEIKLYDLDNEFITLHFNRKFQLERNKRLEKIITNLPKTFSELVLILFIFSVLLFNNLEQDTVAAALMISIIGYSTLRLIPQLLFVVRYYNKLNSVKFVASKVSNMILKEHENKKFNINKETVFFNKELKLKNLTFEYKNTNKEIFKNLDLTIKNGEIGGIVGDSGSGKTTLVSIILGLLADYNGEILVDGKKINLENSNWKKKFSIVPQEIILFNDTIIKNITLNSSSSFDNKFIEKILIDSQMKNFVDNLPYGLNSVIGEDGRMLSVGQRQRLGIARALFRNPEILIFDEATSSLDENNETKFVEFIESLKGSRTVIVISHRKRPLEICDRIYRIEDKKLNQIL